jgi:hypothetical protein
MIGIAIRVRPVAPQLHILEHIMNQTFAETSSAQPRSNQNKSAAANRKHQLVIARKKPALGRGDFETARAA